MAKTTRRARRPARPTTIGAGVERDLLDVYIDELRRTPMMTAIEQKSLARLMRNTTLPAGERSAARDQLIRANLRFAFSIAKQYQNRGLPLEDLISEANAGLCRATDKYDPDVGVNFISYAVWWIRQALFSAITKTSRSVRLPLNRAADLTRIARAQEMLRERLGREPTLEEVGRVAGLAEDIVQSLVALMQPERSLDEPLGGSGQERDGRTLSTAISAATDEDGAFIEHLEAESQRDALRRALGVLPPRDQRIVVMYYGLDTGESMTLDQIAQVFGITRERVRQLRDRALARLRNDPSAALLRSEWAA